MELLGKAISGIINCRLSPSIQFHDVLHAFCAGRRTGPATLEAKLLQKLINLSKIVLRSILIDLSKSYGALYREHCLDILVGYGVGPRTTCILQKYWAQIQMTAKAGGDYGPAL